MESLPRPRPVAVESTQQPIYTVDILLSVPTIAVEPLMAVLQSALQQLGQGPPPSRGAPPSAYTQQQARAQLWAPAPAPKNEKISPMPNSVPTAAGGSLQVLKVLQAMKPPEKKGSSPPRCDRERLPSSEADDGVHHQNVITNSRLRRASREAEDDVIQKDYRLQPAESLIKSSTDVKNMLTDMKKEQMVIVKKRDQKNEGPGDGDHQRLSQHKMRSTSSSFRAQTRIVKVRGSSSSQGVSNAEDEFGGATAEVQLSIVGKVMQAAQKQRARTSSLGGAPQGMWRRYMGPPNTNNFDTLEEGEVGCMFRPDSRWRRRWDSVGLLATLLTLIVQPLQFAFNSDFNLEAGINLMTLSAVCDLFFIVDLFVHFRTARYNQSGRLDFSPRRCARRYIRGGFFADLLAALFPMDLIGLLVVTSGGDPNSIDKHFALFKFMRAWGLNRGVQKCIALAVGEDGDFNPALATMITYSVYMLLFWHWSAFLWWVIGGAGRVDDEFGPSPLLADGTSILQRYMTSMYWSIAITSKVREPMPNMSRQYSWDLTFFSNVVITSGLIFQAMLTGAASGVVISLDSAAAEYNRRLTRISSYLDFKRTPKSLKTRVQKYYRFVWSSTGSMDPDEVMPHLPAPLKAQMDIHSCRSVFVSIPVFQACEPHEILQMIQGLQSHLALPSDLVIKMGSMGRGLFFIMRGTVNIKRKEPKLTDAQQAELKLKFDQMDDDRSGAVDFKELRAAIRALGYQIKSTDLKKLIDGIDADGSGLIEFPEFMEMVLKNKEFLAAVYPDALEDFDDGVDQSEGFFGEETTLSKCPSTLKVQAVTYCDFFVLPVAVLDSVLEQNKNMRTLVAQYAARNTSKLRKGFKKAMLCRAGSSNWGSFTSKDPKSEQLASEGAGSVGLPAAAEPPLSRSASEASGADAPPKRPAGRPAASRSAAEQMSEQMSRPSDVEMMEAEHAALRKVALRRAAAATRISPNLAPNAPVEVQNWW